MKEVSRPPRGLRARNGIASTTVPGHLRRIFGRGWIAAIIVIAAAASGAAPPVRRAVYPAHLPEGPGRATAQRACLMCHSAMLIVQQHKDSTGWEKTVRQMEAWGAPVPPAEHAALLRYLRTRLGAASKR